MIEEVWPRRRQDSRLDRLMLYTKLMPGFCNICGHWTIFKTRHENFREHVRCIRCRSVNRYRQITEVLLALALQTGYRRAGLLSLRDLPSGITIWNTETTRALHEHLSKRLGTNYTASEFLDPALPSGTVRDGVLHADIQNAHFADDSFDYILSSDVMEHVPDVGKALRETYRVLKPGGAHIFTAPFYRHRFSTERRAEMGDGGDIRHLMKPWYHLDPVRPEGVLCFNVFGMELLVQMEEAGFEPALLNVHSTRRGILGDVGFVFVARKVMDPVHRRDLIFPETAA